MQAKSARARVSLDRIANHSATRRLAEWLAAWSNGRFSFARTWTAHAINVRALKRNPSLALRLAKEAGPVLILKGNEPDSLLVHLDESLTNTETGVRPALAASLYREGCVSLGKATQASGLSVSDFIDHLGSLGIDVVRQDETTPQEASGTVRMLLLAEQRSVIDDAEAVIQRMTAGGYRISPRILQQLKV